MEEFIEVNLKYLKILKEEEFEDEFDKTLKNWIERAFKLVCEIYLQEIK